jgi:hypothetical protein
MGCRPRNGVEVGAILHQCRGSIVWNETGGDLPSITEMGSDSRFRPDENSNVVMDSLLYATPWVGWAEWLGEFGNARDLVVLGGETPENAFNTLVDNLNTVISQHTPGT